MRLRTLAPLALLLSLAAPAHAHDYWLEFQPLQPTVSTDVDFTLWVGEDFVAESQKPLEKQRIAALRHITAARDEDLLPTTPDAATPLLRRKLDTTGGHLVALERTVAHIDMRALKFNRYLEHEGLGHVLAERRRTVEHHWRGDERYTRYLKAFVQVGDIPDGVSQRVLGQRIELVPRSELAVLKRGDRLGVTVQFEGKPLPGVQVEAFVRQPGVATPRGQVAISDAAGQVAFTIDQPGAWLVRTVHMQRCHGCKDADWESFWAGYSFAVR